MHSTTFRFFRYVHPEFSQRDRGISLGIDLNPAGRQSCNTRYGETGECVEFRDLHVLLGELEQAITLVESGQLFDDPAFAEVPSRSRGFREIAFRAEHDPTQFQNFDQIVASVVSLKRRRSLAGVKLTVLTNAALLHRAWTQRAMALLCREEVEFWARLDGSFELQARADQTPASPFRQVLNNLRQLSRARPLVIQSCWLRWNGQGPSEAQVVAFCAQLDEIVRGGGRVERVRLTTLSRHATTDPRAAALGRDELDALAFSICAETGLDVEVCV